MEVVQVSLGLELVGAFIAMIGMFASSAITTINSSIIDPPGRGGMSIILFPDSIASQIGKQSKTIVGFLLVLFGIIIKSIYPERFIFTPVSSVFIFVVIAVLFLIVPGIICRRFLSVWKYETCKFASYVRLLEKTAFDEYMLEAKSDEEKVCKIKFLIVAFNHVNDAFMINLSSVDLDNLADNRITQIERLDLYRREIRRIVKSFGALFLIRHPDRIARFY